jgi:hypothetical protein
LGILVSLAALVSFGALVGMMPSELLGFLSQLTVIRRSQVTLSSEQTPIKPSLL